MTLEKLESIKQEAEEYICGLRKVQREIVRGPGRRRASVLTRFDIWFYLRYRYKLTYTKIGDLYGRYRYKLTYTKIGDLYGRHYSTVMDGIKLTSPAEVDLGIKGE